MWNRRILQSIYVFYMKLNNLCWSDLIQPYIPGFLEEMHFLVLDTRGSILIFIEELAQVPCNWRQGATKEQQWFCYQKYFLLCFWKIRFKKFMEMAVIQINLSWFAHLSVFYSISWCASQLMEVALSSECWHGSCKCLVARHDLNRFCCRSSTVNITINTMSINIPNFYLLWCPLK